MPHAVAHARTRTGPIRRPLRVKLLLPALLEANAPGYRAIKYALFPPLGLATLAAYLDPDDEVELLDEHVHAPLALDDAPDLLVMSVYVTSARRARAIADRYRARGTYVCVGGLHPTSLPDEAASHADTVVVGPGEGAWQAFLADFRAGRPQPRYEAAPSMPTLVGIPPVRRDLIDRRRYLCPNSIVVSRGCPHHCDFCYKDAFFEGGRSFYTQEVDAALAEIERLPGRHLYFLDDHLFGNERFARSLFDGMRGMGRLFQGASTVQAILRGDLIERASAAGMRSVFVGFETLNPENLRRHDKRQNLGRDYDEAIRRCHDLGVMVNGSFVFGLDDDGPDVFDRTVAWGIEHSLETSTFHIMTPYPGTALHRRLAAEGRIVTEDWDRYDTRHVVYAPRRMTPAQLEAGYRRAYRDAYRWSAIWAGAAGQDSLRARARHLAYAGGWKKFEPLWDLVIRGGHVNAMLPALERTLDAFVGARAARGPRPRARFDASTLPGHTPPTGNANGRGLTMSGSRDELAERLFGAALGMFDLVTIYVGDRLGLYRALLERGPMTPPELAEAAGIHVRYAREWLEQQAASALLDVEDAAADEDARRYALSAAHAEVLTDPESPYSMAPLARSLVAVTRGTEPLLDAFRSGGGVGWEAFGQDMVEAQGDFNRPWLLSSFGKEHVPSIPDVHERLTSGEARVADIACGAGWAAISLAQAYPAVRVDGFDPDAAAIEIARKNAMAAAVDDRVTFHVRDAGDPSLEGSYDLAVVVEAIHDLSRPVEVLASVRRILKPDGVLIVADERTEDDFHAPASEIERIFYGYSVLCCLPSSMEEQPSAATGTVMRRSTFEGYAREAGFDQVAVLPIEHDLMRFYRLDA